MSQRRFEPPNLLQIAMPLGGIGAGCICLNGYGGLQDFSIRHHPETSATPDTHNLQDAAFALLRMQSGDFDVTRLVEGPLPLEKIYDQGLKGQGFRNAGYEGLPRFRNCSFLGEYPFGTASLSDPKLPFRVEIIGFSPFIPRDDFNSSLPALMLEYRLENVSDRPVAYEFSYHLSHLAPGGPARNWSTTRNHFMPGGVFMDNTESETSPHRGSCALATTGPEPKIKAMWYRGGWFDAITALWREVSEGRFDENDGAGAEKLSGRNGASLLLRGSLEPGETATIPVIIAWHIPNVPWSVGLADFSACNCKEGEACPPCWRPFYAGKFSNAQQVAEYVLENYPSLRARTQAFHDALFSSTLPDFVLDAISANLAILKSPTVLREENGNVWGWEGCFASQGCCHGSCTHVWNYAQAMPHLFPQLERTLREQELKRSMDAEGHVTFRAALPDGAPPHNFHAASDGQLGGVMKVYREWQISGDRQWLEDIYPQVKRSMDWCIQKWDPSERGLIVEPHHNTYDIEFWGPDGMISSFYLGALIAMADMADEIGCDVKGDYYRNLAQKGARAIEDLFNGEYYEQKVTWRGLKDMSFEEKLAHIGQKSSHEDRLLKLGGPKYQYGRGCLADGVLGAWLAQRCQLESPQDQSHVKSALAAIYTYNFKESLWEHANPQRPGYAMGDEPGLLLCTWPNGGKPAFPFPYSDEVWTGFEYQAASHMIEMGLVEEGLSVVRAARSRYDGRVRNPWNEYECGNYYARAMSSYALLEACTGFRYSAVTGELRLDPKLGETVTTFFSTASAWGVIRLDGKKVEVEVKEGALRIDKLCVKGSETQVNETIKAGEKRDIAYHLA